MATGVVAPSGAVREILTKLEKVPDEKIVVIHHGFDLAYFENVNWDKVNALKLKYGLEGKQPVVGVISRFTALKGIQFIIPAFKKLLREYPNALLLFFGGQGDYEKELNALLEEVPTGNYYKVAFENDLSAVYPLFDVFVQVSIDRTIESFGQTYVEALAAGIPSVFTLSGISSDFIKDRENALVVPYQDEDAIYHAILELLTNIHLRENLSMNGRESIKEHFGLPVMIAKLEHLYERG
jgi:glycosyltransferase involved in cell wall biosynthesis